MDTAAAASPSTSPEYEKVMAFRADAEMERAILALRDRAGFRSTSDTLRSVVMVGLRHTRRKVSPQPAE